VHPLSPNFETNINQESRTMAAKIKLIRRQADYTHVVYKTFTHNEIKSTTNHGIHRKLYI